MIPTVCWRKVLAGVFLSLTLAACADHDRSAFASDWGSDRSRSSVRVLVLGQDDRSTDLPRSSSVYDRVLAELQDSMSRRGFEVVDERFIGARLNWSEPYAMSGYDIAEMARLANDSERAADQVDAVVVFHIEALYRELSFATRIQVAVRGRIYDARRGTYLGSFELPVESVPGARGCRIARASRLVTAPGTSQRRSAMCLPAVSWTVWTVTVTGSAKALGANTPSRFGDWNRKRPFKSSP